MENYLKFKAVRDKYRVSEIRIALTEELGINQWWTLIMIFIGHNLVQKPRELLAFLFTRLNKIQKQSLIEDLFY